MVPSARVVDEDTLSLLEYHWYSFARSTERLPPDEIRRLLASLEASRPVATNAIFRFKPAARVFLLTAVDPTSDDAVLATDWRAAVNALKVLRSQYAWGSKQKREKLAGLAAKPLVLTATQAAVVAGVAVPDEMLATLVLDGSEASCDALLPHLERGLTDAASLERLVRLERFAPPTGGARPLLELSRARLAKTKAMSPIHALAAQLGFASGKRLRVQLDFTGTPLRRGAGARARVAFDSEHVSDFHAWVRVKEAWSGSAGVHGHRDDLHLGRPKLSSLPQWFAQAARALKVTWDFDGAQTAYLKGPRLATLLAWLRGESEQPRGAPRATSRAPRAARR